jgi:hypothetical protein
VHIMFTVEVPVPLTKMKYVPFKTPEVVLGLTTTECELADAMAGTKAGNVTPINDATRTIAPAKTSLFLVFIFFTSPEYAQAKRITVLLETDFQPKIKRITRPFSTVELYTS